MAQITLTDILGTDNVALSRTTINQNFQTVENSVNTLENFLNTTPAGGQLSIGSIEITLGSNAVTDELFLNRASGRFQGNLFVDQDIVVQNNLSIGDTLTVEENINLNGGQPGNQLGIGLLGPATLLHQEGMFIDAQFAAIAANSEATHLETSPGIHEVDITGRRVIYFNHASYTGAAGETNVIQLIGTPVQGQRLFIRFADAPAGTFFLDNAGFDSMYNNSFEFAGTTDEIRKKYLEIVYTLNGWVVINQAVEFDPYY